ncbi:hypothetical protein [Nocardia sp. NPDC047038]|uniref:hypothetical protein n=1 Tax=Nocardia sp. NPDC047038 TaxID=3154338 RepID=UPI00340AB78B
MLVDEPEEVAHPIGDLTCVTPLRRGCGPGGRIGFHGHPAKETLQVGLVLLEILRPIQRREKRGVQLWLRGCAGLNQRLLEPGGKALLLAECPPQMLDDPVRLAHISLLPAG